MDVDGLHFRRIGRLLGVSPQSVTNRVHAYQQRLQADNAEVRPYLARFGRKSRCFSRSLEAIRRAVFLFVHAWNTRPLRKRQHPTYPVHRPISFI